VDAGKYQPCFRGVGTAFAGFEDGRGYICYAIHTLLDLNWTMQDILYITDINIELKFIRLDSIGLNRKT
jgi:hypothetical protein